MRSDGGFDGVRWILGLDGFKERTQRTQKTQTIQRNDVFNLPYRKAATPLILLIHLRPLILF